MNSLLFNENGRLRSGLRALIFLFAFYAVLAGASLAVYKSLGLFGLTSNQNIVAFLTAGNVMAFTISILAGALCCRFLEGVPARSLGIFFTPGWLKDSAAGICVGAAAIIFAALIALIFGGMTFRFDEAAPTAAIVATLLSSFMVFIIGAAAEESLFRGYVLQTFSRAGLAWAAILLTSIFFGALHLGNPNSSWISTINTVLAGIWFSAAYLRTRTLWLPFAAHFAWNFVQGSLLGIPVSGLHVLTPAPMLVSIDGGPEWLTGGVYGIEGGVACSAALIVFTILVWFIPGLNASEEMRQLTSPEPN
jgi:uncharacterized protein